MQIKLFAGTPREIEFEVNEFLKDLPETDVKDIKIVYSEGTPGYIGTVVVMIVLRTGKYE